MRLIEAKPLAWSDRALLGVLALSARKPWAIDPSSYTPVHRPLHLTAMTVAPQHQRQGVGRAEVGRVIDRSVPPVYFGRVLEEPAPARGRSRRPG